MSERPRRSQYTAAQKGKGIAESSQGKKSKSKERSTQAVRRTRSRREEPREDPIAQHQEVTTEAGTEEEDVPPKRKHHSSAERPPFRVFKQIIAGFAFVPTKFPDPVVLQELGIYEDVKIILTNMGLQSMLHASFPAYRELTAEFLASLYVVFHFNSPTPEDGHGYITFRANGTSYRVTFRTLSEIYGFADGSSNKFLGNKNNATQFWTTLCSGPHKPGSNKNTDIRNPALRYVHRILTHSFYSRREGGGVNEAEMLMMDRGIAPLIGTYANKETPAYINFAIGVVGVFMNCLLKLQHWCYTNQDITPQISIGGWITPILAHVGCLEGVEPTVGPDFINEAHLVDSHYLVGRLSSNRNLVAYQFNSSNGRARVKALLPNPARTDVTIRENLIFKLEPHELYNAAVHGLLEKMDAGAAAPQAEDEPVHEPEPIYGSSRYYFDPFGEALPAGPLREAHEHIRSLNRWNRYQDRAIRNLTKTVKVLKKCVKKLNKKVFSSGVGSCRHRSDATPMDEFDAPIPEHRHSYHGDHSLALVPTEAHRASYYETRRPRRHFPSPPPNLSDNESPSLSTPPSSDEPDEPAH